MLTEVLKEREAQLELKRLKEQASHGKDKEWLEIAQREYEEAIRLDQTKAAERIIAAAENQGFLKAQYVLSVFYSLIRKLYCVLKSVFSSRTN
jgi:flagellar biosynthesis/type III secretory pathway protein FliH